jgi:membrane fusion protein, heavy metal efflux system
MTFKYLIGFISMVLIAACSNKQEPPAEEEKPLLAFSQKQLASVGILLGKVEAVSMADEVSATGIIDVPPQNMATISTFIQGKVSGINTYPGVKVSKGTILCYLTHPDIITFQEQYVKANAALMLAESEMQRQTNLTKEEATTTKKLQTATSELATMKADVQSLEAKLVLFNINSNQVKSGQFVNRIAIRASISGFVKEVLVNEGKTVAANEALFTVINTDHLHLELKVYERDSYKIKDGQAIVFSVRSQPDKFYNATIYVAGKNLDAKIKVGTSSQLTLPSTSILEEGKNHFVFVGIKEGANVFFEKQEIKVGATSKGFTIIQNPKQWKDKNIVVKNADFLEAQINNSEEEE